jgi:hypothetical protein
MGSRTLTEGLHLAAGLAVTVAVFRVAAWAYPFGGEVIDKVGWGTLALVLVMGAVPLRDAWRADRHEKE